jgi:glutathione S-transferase
MSATPLVLYSDAFWISPYVYTCFVALREKGLDFEVKDVALQDKQQHDPSYRDGSITGRVPSLRHGDFWLAESSAIVEYLDEAFPDRAPLLPKDVRERARARQVLAWIRSDLLALREQRSTATMFYERATKPLDAAGQAALDKLLHVATLLVPEGRSTLSSTWSIADADLTFMLQRAGLNGHDLPARIRAYVDANWSRPSIQAFVTHQRIPYVPY